MKVYVTNSKNSKIVNKTYKLISIRKNLFSSLLFKPLREKIKNLKDEYKK